MSTNLKILAQNGLESILGWSPKQKEIILLEGCENYVRFTITKHENIEYAVTFKYGFFSLLIETEAGQRIEL